MSEDRYSRNKQSCVVDQRSLTRREFIKASGSATLAMAAGVCATKTAADERRDSVGPWNILMILTDQERLLDPQHLPTNYRLPGHERLAETGVVFQNHQIASCVCTPSRSVIYTGRHIQNSGMFDNTNFPWQESMSTDVPTVGHQLRNLGYYTAYKGKWHLTREFETANNVHHPKRILVDEMEAYGFSDYFGIGDVIGHTEGGYLHDGVTTAMTRSWLRGQARNLHGKDQPWFLAVNLVNPHDVMYYNTDRPGERRQQNDFQLAKLNRDPNDVLYRQRWDVELPASRHQDLDQAGRPAAHDDYRRSRAALVGIVPDEDEHWHRLNNYYLNCVRDADRHIVEILDELDRLGLSENTVVILTADHGELGGAHGLSGKGATAYREQNNVPFIVSHPGYAGGKRCRAVTSHLDIAPTLLGIAGGEAPAELRGKDITALLGNPEAAGADALRPGALFCYNMLAYADGEFLPKIARYFAAGGTPEALDTLGLRPDMQKRSAIRSVFDGRYRFSRYFSPKEHHVPNSLEQLFAVNDVELYDLQRDPLEVNNLAIDRTRNGDLLLAMNAKLNAVIQEEVGEDVGQMLPGGENANWTLSPDLKHLRM